MAMALQVAERAAHEAKCRSRRHRAGRLLVRAGNRVEADKDPTACRDAGNPCRSRNVGCAAPPYCDLYVTLEALRDVRRRHLLRPYSPPLFRRL